MRILPCIALVAACTPDPGGDRSPDLPPGGALVVACTDYEVGTVVLVDPATGAVSDALVATGGDPQVRVVDDLVAVIDRSAGEGLRLFDPTDWATPVHAIPVDAPANLHDVAAWEGQLVATQYERDTLLVADLGDGLVRQPIPLDAWSDADGLPEASSLWTTPDGVFAALQRLDRTDGWAPRGGRLVRVDPTDGTASEVATLGPNPRLRDGVLTTGVYFQADGALARVDPDGTVLPPVLTEEEVQADLGATATIGEHTVVTGIDLVDGDTARVWCVDWSDGAVVEGPAWAGLWAAAATPGPDDGAWLALRSGWTGTPADAALVRIDPETCATTASVPLPLEPYDVAPL